MQTWLKPNGKLLIGDFCSVDSTNSPQRNRSGGVISKDEYIKVWFTTDLYKKKEMIFSSLKGSHSS